MVSTDYLRSNCLDHVNTEEVLCVHGDKVHYPTADVRLRLSQWSRVARVARVVAAPGIPVPVLLRTDIYELTASNPVMVTTRAQARRGCDVTCGTDDAIKETTSDLGMTTEDTPAEDVKNGECGKTTTEMEVVEPRREEVPLSTSRIQSFRANADDIRQWQAADSTLTKARDEAREKKGEERVGFYYFNGLLYQK